MGGSRSEAVGRVRSLVAEAKQERSKINAMRGKVRQAEASQHRSEAEVVVSRLQLALLTAKKALAAKKAECAQIDNCPELASLQKKVAQTQAKLQQYASAARVKTTSSL